VAPPAQYLLLIVEKLLGFQKKLLMPLNPALLRSLLKTLEISEFPNKIANLNSAQSSVEGKIHDDPRAQESVPLGLNGCAVATPQTLVTAPCANRPAQGR